MKWIKFFIPLLITLGLSYVLNTSSPFGIQDIPALGKLMSPFEGFWQNAKAESKSDYKNRRLKGLKANVEVVYDERLVPHIFADNLEDALFAQGYVTAQHRLWQMDIATRAAAGQLSEVLGARTLEYDRLQRRRGMLVAAERAVESWKESEDYYLLEAYAAGVNAYIQKLSPKDYPTEYKLMGFQPTPWTMLRSALFLKNMAQTLNFRYEDLEATNSLAMFGNATFDFLFPELNQKQSPVIPVGTIFKTDSIRQSNLTDTIPLPIGQRIPYPALPRSEVGIGSNNWAVFWY
ncbi:MAG: penicillin acylase family protein [Saprospiraceae bacterium]|nr:penicillin acylase family protein [Saprospiraceae bacterium]